MEVIKNFFAFFGRTKHETSMERPGKRDASEDAKKLSPFLQAMGDPSLQVTNIHAPSAQTIYKSCFKRNKHVQKSRNSGEKTALKKIPETLGRFLLTPQPN